MEKQEALKYIADIFSDFHISYALIGAYAVAVWGVPRATHDIDFIADVPKDKIQKILKRLQSSGLKAELNTAGLTDPVLGVIKVSFEDKIEETIDILLGIKNMPSEIFKHTSKFMIFGSETPVISPEDLIISKLIAGSPVDIEDAKKIFKIMKGKMDLSYINNFCKSKNIRLPK